MEPKNEQHQLKRFDTVSRRGLMKGAVAMTAAWSARTPAAAQSSGTIYAYIGAYNPNSLGINIYRMDPNSGILTPIASVADANPSSVAIDPSGKHLYVINEISNFMGTTTGSVTAYSIDRSTGKLTKLNAITSGGAGPAHVSVDATGKWVFAANYGEGNFAVLPINPDGSVGAPTDVQAAVGPLGPTQHPGRPPGTYANSGHDAHHAHMAATDPSNKYVLHTDLGSDELTVWNFDAVAGKLTRNNIIKSLPGGGPRHFAFHPNGRWLYVINEEDSTLLFAVFDPSSGKLTPTTFISTLPDNFQGTNYTSEIGVTADGRFAYGLNRLYNTIALFSLDQATGTPALVSNEWTRGDYPRFFAIDPSGNFMYVLHSRSSSATVFSINKTTGALTFTGQFIPVDNASGMAFLTT